MKADTPKDYQKKGKEPVRDTREEEVDYRRDFIVIEDVRLEE